MTQVPSLGRVVLYVLPSGKVRPALVVEPWSADQPNPAWRGKVNLQVFLDGDNDAEDVRKLLGFGVGVVPEYAPFVLWRGSVEHEEGAAPRPGTWRWPPRVETSRAPQESRDVSEKDE